MPFGFGKKSNDSAGQQAKKAPFTAILLSMLAALALPLWLLAFCAWCVQLIGLILIQVQLHGGHFLMVRLPWQAPAKIFPMLCPCVMSRYRALMIL